MNEYQLINIIYIDNNDNYFLKYELGGDANGNYSFAMIFIPQAITLNGVNYTNWLEYGSVDLNQYTKDRNGVMQACRAHRANWQV